MVEEEEEEEGGRRRKKKKEAYLETAPCSSEHLCAEHTLAMSCLVLCRQDTRQSPTVRSIWGTN